MAKRMFLLLLTLIGVGCGNTPTTPLPPVAPEPVAPPPPPVAPEPENVTLTFVLPYPKGKGPAVAGASITCLEGCPDKQTLSTDPWGQLTFPDVYPPLVIEARKDGHITRQVRGVRSNQQVVLTHVWPDEVKESLEHLEIPVDTIIHFVDTTLPAVQDTELVRENLGGLYECSTLVIKEEPPKFRRNMMVVVWHELFHAHQDGMAPGLCNPHTWTTTEQGRAYAQAWEADQKAEGLLPRIDLPRKEYEKIFQTGVIENSAEFYARWINQEDEWEDMCTIAKARCQFMEEEFGPRPN